MAITNAELKKMVNYGAARDITDKTIPASLRKNLTRVLTVSGSYGINGALYVSNSGKCYVATNRNTVLQLPH